MNEPFDTIEEALADIAAGKLVIVTDDENRENEGDLVMAASKATPETVNMMIRHARGLICVPTVEHQLRRLGISQMVPENRESQRTAFAVSVDAAEGISTGISAYDRAKTIAILADPQAKPEALVQPGHIFPLLARPGGVLQRAGHTEAAVDLASLAGLHPSGVICEILNEDGSKMSKRDAGAAVGDYPRQGFLPQAVVNFIALLGWSSKSADELFSLAELTDRFSLEGINRAPGRFDLDKCSWVNQQHIMRLSDADFAAAAMPFVADAGLPTADPFPAAAAMVKEKVRLLKDVAPAIDFLLSDDIPSDPEAVARTMGNPVALANLPALADAFAAISDWSADAAKAALATVAQAAGAKPGQWMPVLRIALSGRAHGPDLGAILDFLGSARCAARLRAFATKLPV